MPTDDRSAKANGGTEPTYDSTLADIPGAQRDHRATVARHQQTGGFPGWQYLASSHRHRLERWDTLRRSGVHQRAYSYGIGQSVCICGLIVADDPEVSGRWLDFFSAHGHLDIKTGESARIFIAQGGPYRLGMVCAACGETAMLPEGVLHHLDDELLKAIAEAHLERCPGDGSR